MTFDDELTDEAIELEAANASQSETLALKFAERIHARFSASKGHFWDAPSLGIVRSGIALDPEQIMGVKGIYDKLRLGHAEMFLEAPTGWGKTVAIMKFMELLQSGSMPPATLIVANDIGDLQRWEREFRKHDPALGSGKPQNYVGTYYSDSKQLKRVTITTYASFVNLIKEDKIPRDYYELILLDEGHVSLTDLRQDTLSKVSGVKIFLSATPSYSRDKSLSARMPCAYSCSPQRAEELGLIAPFQQVVVIQPKVKLDSEVVLSTGSLDDKELHKRFKKANLTETFIDFYKNWAQESGAPIWGRQGIINCLSVVHADEVALEINARFGQSFPNGIIPAVALNGETPKEFRKWAVEQYIQGNILMLCGAELFVHGFDAPNVDFVFNLAPSVSGVKVGQRGGRARRRDRTGKNPNKIAIIADVLFDNTSPFGWQLLYSEWVDSRLYRKADPSFPILGLKQKIKSDTQGLAEDAEFNWDSVPDDTIIDKADGVQDLIAWREKRFQELRPAPNWTTRFPFVWDFMKLRGIKDGLGLVDVMRQADPNFSVTTVESILTGRTKHYNPDKYLTNWHPTCLAIANALGVHVRQLFPRPEGAPIQATPERRAELLYQARFKLKMIEAGFDGFPKLAEFLDLSLSGVRTAVYTRPEVTKYGWPKIAMDVANALNTTPEDLYGRPKALRESFDMLVNAAARPAGAPELGTLTSYFDQPPEVLYDKGLIKDSVRLALLTIPAREEKVIRHRFGLGTPELTLDEVGSVIGVTRERARGLEIKGLQRLRHPVRAGKLRALIPE